MDRDGPPQEAHRKRRNPSLTAYRTALQRSNTMTETNRERLARIRAEQDAAEALADAVQARVSPKNGTHCSPSTPTVLGA